MEQIISLLPSLVPGSITLIDDAGDITPFNQMTQVVQSRSKIKLKTGRPGKLSIENQLLMTLEYCREYRTYFHIGQ